LKIRYEKLAIATGASPKRALPSHSRVIRLRDTQTIKELEEQLKDTRRILIIGNGGIASELV
jgi:NAD(P)H-nitrite reductase large subunit